MVTRNERKNGGAVRPWESIALKPMSLKIVGRKTGCDVRTCKVTMFGLLRAYQEVS